MAEYEIGKIVERKWGKGTGSGTIRERFTRKVARTIRESEVTRDASQDNPAYMVEQDERDRVLKSASELN